MMRGWRGVVAIAALAWGAALVYAALSGRAMYGDGALYVLIHFQVPHRFDDYDFQRSFASFVTQSPILLAERLGIERVSVYAAGYAVGVFFVPALAMLAALFLARAQPLLFAAVGAGIAVYGFGVNFINTEANLFFGLAWLAVAILALERAAPVLRGFLLPLIGVVLLRTYEGMLLAGPILAAWALVASGRVGSDRERLGLGVAAILFTLGAVIGLGGYLSPRDPGNATSFVGSAFKYLGNPQVFLLAAAIAVLPAVVRPRPGWLAVSGIAAAAAGIAYLVAMGRLHGYYAYNVYYDNRSFLVLSLPAFVAALFAVYALRPQWLRGPGSQRGYGLLLVPLGFAVAADIAGTAQWGRFTDEFCAVLRKEGTPAERLALLRQADVRTAWTWTHPTMSVLLRDRGSDAMVGNEPGQRWEPFPASNPPSIGRLGLCQAPLLGDAR